MPLSLYIHIPFCRHRCAYCDFNTHAGKEALIPDYIQALCTEIEVVARGQGKKLPAHTLYIGGGTPSLLTVGQVDRIIGSIRRSFAVQPEAEISLEANPGTVSQEYLQDLVSLGVNRLSLGAQSMQPRELSQLERIHDPLDTLKAVHWARQAGISNLNLDLIYALPGQNLESWKTTLRLIEKLHPEHLSLYCLTIEEQTPFGRWLQHGKIPKPDNDLAADMYEWAAEVLITGGYRQYEISNWSKPGFQCAHNLQYWKGGPYMGFGAGAHGYIDGFRVANVLGIRKYIERVKNGHKEIQGSLTQSPAQVERHRITPGEQMREAMITGLRLTEEGVNGHEFRKRFGSSLMDVFSHEIQQTLASGLVEWNTDSLRLTRRGRLLGNQVFMQFVD
jgi:oxygen-independent coproporphyrinogen-3 oxidase